MNLVFRTLLKACVLIAAVASFEAQALVFTEEEKQFMRDHPAIVVGGETDWPPFDFVANGQYTGLAKDYLDIIEDKIGLKLDIVTGYAWDELLGLMRNKQIDVLPMLYWSEERTDYIAYTDSYLTIRQYVFGREGAKPISSLDDLSRLVVAIPKGYAQIELLTQRYKGIQIFETKGPLAAIDAVITGQADVLIESTALVAHLTKENNLHGLQAMLATDFGVNEIYMGARADWPILRDIFQKAINDIDRTKRQVISQKWLQFGEQSVQPPSGDFTPLELDYLDEKGSVKACVDPDWMPLEKLENGLYTGLGSDYLKLFQARLGVPIQVVPTETWAQSKEFAKARVCDLLVLSSDTASRREFMDVTKPYVELPLVVATRNDVLFLSDISQLTGKPIGIISSYALRENLETTYPEFTFVGVETRDEGLEKVIDGELYGYVDTVSAIGYAIQKKYWGELKITGKFDINWELSVATRKDQPLLGEIFEKLILGITEADKVQIFNRWIPSDYEKRVDYKLIWQILIGALVVVGLLAYRHIKLMQYKNTIEAQNTKLDKLNSKLLHKQHEIAHMAYHDGLTGLPNKAHLMDIAEHAIKVSERHKRKLALIFIDLDRFKTINDTLGHAVGDQLLQSIAAALESHIRSCDTLSRIGGDEFVLLVEDIAEPGDTTVIANNVMEIIAKPVEVGEYKLNTTASIGIALYPNDGHDVDTLMKNADSAMYAAKDAGKNCIHFYTPDLSNHLSRRVFLENEIPKALERGDFTLVFQPKIDLSDMSISGAETLIRWHHPGEGFISPAEFIPIAEDSGLIIDIGEWVFRQACRQLKQWLAQGLDIKVLAINVASAQLRLPNVVSIFAHAAHEYDIDPRRIEIEITEHSFLENTSKVISTLRALREAGFRIAIDDFGTGYSSMGYLKAMPLSVIKIDQSFVADIPDDENGMQISSAIIALSHSLGFEVVAEGVETKEQEAFLRKQGCDFVQGYLYGKPHSAELFEEFVKSHKF